MESLSRPPHRRKHSAAANVVKGPYDDVLLSGGGKRKPFEAHEYTEIFSGSSSIPVLDLSGLDERVGSGSPKLDYSNIFGGLGNDDVAVPFEELVNGGSAKKSKPRIPADARSPSQESNSQHSSAKTKRPSGEEPGQPVDALKQQINMSFNRTSQINTDTSNGKTHVTQLHAVPGFTYFVDGTSRLQKTEDDRPAVSSLKREVSRTWSFSAEVEAAKSKGGLNGDKSPIPDKSLNENEINPKPHFLKVPPPSTRPSNLRDDNDPRRSRVSSFASKQDASEKTDGESPPSFFGEEFDENSVAAVSAATLKKAIEQAQESIRIAKMIMDRKKQGLQDGSKPRSSGRLKVKDKKETKIAHEAYGSKEKNAREKNEREVDRKFTSPLGYSGPLIINAEKAEVERVRENVGAAKEHAEAFSGVGKISAPSSSQGDTLYIGEKVELTKLGENVEAAEAHRVVANAEPRTANLESGKVGNNNSLMLSTNKLASEIKEIETGKEILEQREVSIYNTKGPEIVEKLPERALDTPESMQETEKSVKEESEQYQATFDLAKGFKNIIGLVESVFNTSQRTPEQEKIVDEAGEILGISQENEGTGKREPVTDDKGKSENKFEECGEMVEKSESDILPNVSGNLAEKEVVKQEETEKESENVPECKESDNEEERQKEANMWFESEEQLKEASDEEINNSKLVDFPEIEKFEEPEIDAYVGEGLIVPEKLEQNEIEEKHVNVYEYEAAQSVVVEANNSVEAQKSAIPRDVEENRNECEYHEADFEKNIDEAVDGNNSEAHSTIYSQTQEACDVELNSGEEECEKEVKSDTENDSVPGVTEAFSAIDKDEKAEQLFHLEDNEIPEVDILRRSVSEEFFDESKLLNSFEDPSVNVNSENFGVMDAENEEKLSDVDSLETSSETRDDSQEDAAKDGHGENLPEVHPSNVESAEFEIEYLRQVLEQTSESDEASAASTSSLDNIDGFSAHESEECAENAKDNNTSLKYEVETPSNESKHVEEPKETEKPMETERAPNMEKTAKEQHVQNFDKSDHLQRIEAIKKGREREKDRIVVERAIREARERAFAEARERAERAAVERASAEARQRAMAEARDREKLEKVNKQKSTDKASTEAKLRAERAAVERATAEARERALEKAMSQKASTTQARTQTHAERSSSSSRSNGLKHSFSSSDLDKCDGSNVESAQRRKARLERHQRIMERASKALEEKNMRDLLAQKEQAERNRLAEPLDAEIKRWASGKEGNLRALLSTLQYILGADSGWQPISLTEIITTVAVKKAYRKATLYVHPDKLQQRGASIHQKYICEKVFDLLKAAWNRFNSEER